MDVKTQKAKIRNQIKSKNVLEAINEIGSQVVTTAKNEVKATSDEFFRQLLGQQKLQQEKRSGEVPMGQSLQMNEVMSGQEEKNKRLQEQIFFERRLFSEEKQATGEKLNELRLRLQAIQTEATKMVATTASLSQEIKIAVMQGAANVSEYQINFYEDIISLIIAFRKKIDNAVVWMQSTNKRAEKKNFWAQYKKKGSSFLLSGETYSQRSAG
ncbi:MAG: hypothetical protein ACD_19C00021G0012 [uncultured bacterium]|nr:MAG: hypothetical protein ACD_19C00021G0012 [uncultured bacterium]